MAELLEARYRSEDLGNLDDVLAECVYIILSRQTQEGVYRPLYRALRQRYPLWRSVLAANAVELEELLFGAGLHKQRAAQLKGLLSRVAEDNLARGLSADADLTLEYLRDEGDDDAEKFLIALPGLGKKSARCVMHYALGRQVFAVDTHVWRILTRLELIPSQSYKADQDPLQDLIPRQLRQKLHVNLVHHGRSVCKAKKPACHECVLVSWCDVGKDRAASAGGDKPVAVDLFSGAGGLSAGFEEAGWRVALAVEGDRNAAQTYRYNHPGTPVAEADVRRLSADDIRSLGAGAEHVDALLAGPPCQGYSAAGKRLPEDSKNQLFRQVSRLGAALEADFIVMENVLGLQRVRGTEFVSGILRSLRAKGYDAEAHELDAREFGVAQHRRRLLFLAGRVKSGRAAPGRPARSVASYPSGHLLRVLADLPPAPPGWKAERVVGRDGSELLNASTMLHSEKVVTKISAIAQGRGPLSYRRLAPDAARTLIAGHRALPVHPTLHRTISVREAARIQGFDDGYLFMGTRASQPLQVANAVPPPLGAAIARMLRRKIRYGARVLGADSTGQSPRNRAGRQA